MQKHRAIGCPNCYPKAFTDRKSSKLPLRTVVSLSKHDPQISDSTMQSKSISTFFPIFEASNRRFNEVKTPTL
jgi:hypothetical protein